MVNTPTAEALWVSGPGGAQQIPNPMGTDGVTVSGTRLLENQYDGSATLFDLVAGTSTNLPAPVGPPWPTFSGQQPYQLSGNKLAWLASDGSVWMKNLDTAVATQLSPALTAAGQTVTGSVAIAGDTVAWAISLCIVTGVRECINQPASYRNFATMGPIQTIPSEGAVQIALSAQYLAFEAHSTTTSSWDLYVNPLYTPTVNDITSLAATFTPSFSISGSTIGWVGGDRLVHAQALTHIAERPRYLGNGIAPSALVADGHAYLGCRLRRLNESHDVHGDDQVWFDHSAHAVVRLEPDAVWRRASHLGRQEQRGHPRRRRFVHVDIDRRER